MKFLAKGEAAALFDPQHFAYLTGMVLRGYSVQKKAKGWQVIFRATTRKGLDVYSLFVAGELEGAIAGLFKVVSSKGGSRYWHKDKFSA